MEMRKYLELEGTPTPSERGDSPQTQGHLWLRGWKLLGTTLPPEPLSWSCLG